MIESIQIKNFKSVVDLSLELGTFNVLIGENGCGKSNILEAIAFGAAASADKLDFEFMGSRGIRLTNPEFMFSAFAGLEKENRIRFVYKLNKENHTFNLMIDSNKSKRWINENLKSLEESLLEMAEEVLKKDSTKNIDNVDYSNEQTYSPKEKLFSVHQIMMVIKQVSYKQDFSNYIIYSPEQSSLRKYEETNQILSARN